MFGRMGELIIHVMVSPTAAKLRKESIKEHFVLVGFTFF
jgi:hypothetical protein